MGWYVGVDIGSYTCKGALTRDGTLVDSVVLPSGTDYSRTGWQLLEGLLSRNHLSPRDLGAVVATGNGAKRADFADAFVADIICSARGINVLAPSVRTLIDIGSQSTQVIWVDEVGRVAHFASNEKCATGSGRFLQVMANVLRVRLEEVGPLSLTARHPVTFTTGCAVFGESEAITRVSEGVPKEDILAGVHRSLAEKIGSLTRGRGLERACALCGGGALDTGLVRSIEEQLATKLFVPPDPQIVTALGAALLAMKGHDVPRAEPEADS
ncbi:MAG: 2-hydroxyglutaryl-CoA dehydratase [Deltaproteobacteria bacterium]|nr:2-hydroxyglutaryl-CoA dehydratase [Deltaproteobacteria bacterium]